VLFDKRLPRLTSKYFEVFGEYFGLLNTLRCLDVLNTMVNFKTEVLEKEAGPSFL
jgi:hypothetical protein